MVQGGLPDAPALDTDRPPRGCQGTKFGGKIASVFLEGTVELGTLATPRVAAAAVTVNPCRIGQWDAQVRS